MASAKIIVGTGRAAGMRIEQIVTEGEYQKGRLIGIEDGAALMWNTEMLRLGHLTNDGVTSRQRIPPPALHTGPLEPVTMPMI